MHAFPHTQGVLYFAVFIVIGGIAPCIATTIVWAGNTFGNHYKRATSMGLTFSLGEFRSGYEILVSTAASFDG